MIYIRNQSWGKRKKINNSERAGEYIMIDGDSEVKRIHGQFQINLEGFSAVTKFGNLGRIPNPERKKTTRLEARDYKTRNGFE